MASTTRTSTDGRERRAAVESHLLAGVESLLSTGESFTELSMQRLAQGAGVSRSTFYLYFPGQGRSGNEAG